MKVTDVVCLGFLGLSIRFFHGNIACSIPVTLKAGSISTPVPPKPTRSKCGHSSRYDRSTSSIVGGQDVYVNEFPWMVHLLITTKGLFGLKLKCGASIIHSRWLLTAAHCVQNAKSIVATFAEHDLKNPDPGQHSQEVYESGVFVHRHWKDPYLLFATHNPNMEYDFALLRLSTPLDFDKHTIQRICLPDDCDDGCGTGMYAYIAGWGRVNVGDWRYPTTLQVGLTEIVGQDTCFLMHEEFGPPMITDWHICAAAPCYGDSGGPLMVNEDGFFKICGVASWARACGSKPAPAVFSKVCRVKRWIEDTIAAYE